MNRIKQLLVCLTLLCVESLAAQHVSIEAQMDSAVILMGKQTRIRLAITQDDNQQQLIPLYGDTLITGVEVVRKSTPDTLTLGNNRIEINQELYITSFDSGFYYIPPMQYLLDTDTFASQSLSLKVIPVEVDTLQQPAYGIKAIREPQFVWTDYLPDTPILLAVAALLLLAVAAFYLVRYYKRKEKPVVEIKEVIPAHIKALSSLEQLKAEKLWQNEREKEYYTRLTEIIRLYITEQFDVDAQEMTTQEILTALKKNKEVSTVYKSLREMLTLADYVKFAKLRPLADENDRMLRYAYEFVAETQPRKEEAETPTTSTQTPEN